MQIALGGNWHGILKSNFYKKKKKKKRKEIDIYLSSAAPTWRVGKGDMVKSRIIMQLYPVRVKAAV